MKSDILLACALLPHLFGNFHSIWHGSVVCTTPLYLQSDGAPSPLLHHQYICTIHVLTSPTETMISVRVLSSECMDSYS